MKDSRQPYRRAEAGSMELSGWRWLNWATQYGKKAKLHAGL